ncbi:MAG: hypothetical protein AVDCRST_MAG67-3978 [uncultured Solirubrobacteraceae bacterium]|uniref:Uncharacterized protein n=1 Tax=uncultured Solirubrobacteraceae bacterium TaxID=1162706 RepID=A0A6J4TSD0_9ACTN|nr:MAG: hypothetical protein AVDCRST_MAG67-3978 [uncultured Solirubrobacteraceae bacterium]
MHPVEHRGLRELYAMTRQLRDHWRRLAAQLGADAPEQAQLLRDGSQLARALLAELSDVTAQRGIFGRPTAQGLGVQLARVHSGALDTALEVHQALRFAVLDVVHVVTLLEFLAQVAEHDRDPQLVAFLAGWAAQLRDQEQALRATVLALAADPDLAVRASVPSAAGRIGHGAANLIGSFGEWFDRRAAR